MKTNNDKNEEKRVKSKQLKKEIKLKELKALKENHYLEVLNELKIDLILLVNLIQWTKRLEN